MNSTKASTQLLAITLITTSHIVWSSQPDTPDQVGEPRPYILINEERGSSG